MYIKLKERIVSLENFKLKGKKVIGQTSLYDKGQVLSVFKTKDEAKTCLDIIGQCLVGQYDGLESVYDEDDLKTIKSGLFIFPK